MNTDTIFWALAVCGIIMFVFFISNIFRFK